MIEGIYFDITREELAAHMLRVSAFWYRQLDRLAAIEATSLTTEQRFRTERHRASMQHIAGTWAEMARLLARETPEVGGVFRLTSAQLDSIEFPISRLERDVLSDEMFRASILNDANTLAKLMGVGAGSIIDSGPLGASPPGKSWS